MVDLGQSGVQVDDLLDAFGELCDQLPLAAVIHETCSFA